jgi:hypothetical protein
LPNLTRRKNVLVPAVQIVQAVPNIEDLGE